jgi:pimeloyl-ACP methyl ester carboxylesterase
VSAVAQQAVPADAEQTRARYPDATGYVERDGVRVFWERYGDGEPTILFLPTWTLIHSRCWKAQVPYLARHFRVLTLDPRGNGRSDRPHEPAAYAETEFARDAAAVMDATDTDRAVLVCLSKGAQRALLLATDHPERVLGAAFVGPFFPVSPLHGLRWRIMLHKLLLRAFFVRPLVAAGWWKFNAAHMRHDYRDFIEWFIRRVNNTPHSTKQMEDAIGWALETDAEALIASVLGDQAAPATRRDQMALARRVRCPVLVISAPNDKITAHADAKALARATGGELVTVREGGHAPQARKPVAVNLALRAFVEQVARNSRVFDAR